MKHHIDKVDSGHTINYCWKPHKKPWCTSTNSHQACILDSKGTITDALTNCFDMVGHLNCLMKTALGNEGTTSSWWPGEPLWCGHSNYFASTVLGSVDISSLCPGELLWYVSSNYLIWTALGSGDTSAEHLRGPPWCALISNCLLRVFHILGTLS